MRNNITATLLLSSVLLMNGCNSNTETESIISVDDSSLEQDTTTTETGSAKIYIEDRASTSITTKARIIDESGIESITIYCINAYKYYEERETVVVDQATEVYNSGETKLKFFEHTFKGLQPQKSYVIKTVAQTEAGQMSQQTTTATIGEERTTISQSLDLGAYSIYHVTEAQYIFNLTEFTPTDSITIEEFDGDFGLFTVILKDASGREVTVGTDLVSSGNNVAKVHTLINPDKTMIVTSVVINAVGAFGGLWQFNEILINP